VRCPEEIEDQEHEQVLPAGGPRSSANAIAENTSGWAWQRSALRPAACTPSRPPARAGVQSRIPAGQTTYSWTSEHVKRWNPG
jgi:hypothetical protein